MKGTVATQKKQYACIDLKSYYASVECVDRGLDPLTTNLVVADESRSDGTICLVVSPSLKALGVPGRPRLFEVKQRLAEIKALTGKTVPYITAMPRMARYLEVSSEIYGIYLKYLSPSGQLPRRQLRPHAGLCPVAPLWSAPSRVTRNTWT